MRDSRCTKVSLKAIAVNDTCAVPESKGENELLIYNPTVYFVYNRVNKHLSNSRDDPMRVKKHEDAVKRTHATAHKIQCQMRLSGSAVN